MAVFLGFKKNKNTDVNINTSVLEEFNLQRQFRNTLLGVPVRWRDNIAELGGTKAILSTLRINTHFHIVSFSARRQYLMILSLCQAEVMWFPLIYHFKPVMCYRLLLFIYVETRVKSISNATHYNILLDAG